MAAIFRVQDSKAIEKLLESKIKELRGEMAALYEEINYMKKSAEEDRCRFDVEEII